MVAVSLDRKAVWEPEIIASEIDSEGQRYVLGHVLYYEKDSARKYELLSRMALEARDAEDEQSRMNALANLAVQTAEAGFVNEARPLAQEAQDILERMPVSATNENMWFTIVNAWSLIDSAKVKELAHRVKIVEERLACNVARIDPIVAKEIYDGYLKRTPKPRGGHWISELAYTMAKTDLATAERYADVVLLRTDRFDSVGSPEITAAPQVFGVSLEIPHSNEGPAMWRAVLQGYLADARREVGDPEGAKRLLADAVSRLERIQGEAWHTGGGFLWNRSTCMAALIPLAERIDESLVAEMVWKTLAVRSPLEEIDSNSLEQRTVMANASAGVIARYRPDLAKHVIDGNAELQSRQSWRGSASVWVGTAYFDVDPAAAVHWSESLCNLPDPFSAAKPAKSPRAVSQTFLSSVLRADGPRKPTLGRWRTLLSLLWLENVVDKNAGREE
jgi:hypothetical protein